jgi:hypothetical protein
LSVDTRLGLLEVVFQIFFDFVENFPKSSGKCKISEKTTKGCNRKTFWTSITCKRACNLCVGLYWSIMKWSEDPCYPLALNRVSSHPVECHFGTTRSTLDGDARWESFLNAEISAILIRRSIAHLELRPYIRRFRTEAGCTLTCQGRRISDVCFGFIVGTLSFLAGALRLGQRWPVCGTPVVAVFRALAEFLAQADWRERAGKSGLLSGGCITLRLFTLSKAGEEGAPPPETAELLAILADE